MRFNLHVTPDWLGQLEIGKVLNVKVNGEEIPARIIAIDGNLVTHEVADVYAPVIERLFKQSDKSFSISSKGVR